MTKEKEDLFTEARKRLQELEAETDPLAAPSVVPEPPLSRRSAAKVDENPVKPFRAKSVDRLQRVVGNLLAAAHWPLYFRSSNLDFRLRLLPYGTLPGIDKGLDFCLRIAGFTCVVTLDQWPYSEAVGGQLDGAAFARLPDSLAAGILTVQLEEFLSQLAQALDEPVSLGESRSAWQRHTQAIALGLILEERNGRTVHMIARMPIRALAVVVKALRRWPAPPLDHLWGSLRLDSTIAFGRSQLTVEELKKLTVGDIVLLSECYAQRQDRYKILLSDRQAFFIKKQAEVYVVDEVAQNGAPGGDAGTVVDVESLTVTLEFNLGHRALTLAELKSLAPGHIFKLEEPISESVTILCNGQRLGTGEIVEVEKKTGVRILQVFGKG